MEKISVTITVKAPIQKVWEFWTDPEHIQKWNNAMEGWQTTNVKNDVRNGGKFNFRMESKKENRSFDYKGVYDEVVPNELLAQTLDDGRTTKLTYKALEGETEIIETFEPDSNEPIAMQREFCKSVLDSFKVYVEGNL